MINKTYQQLLKTFENNHLVEPFQSRNIQFPSFKIMGIVNVTPDSFSDGGLYLRADLAYKKILNFIDKGVDIVDIGAESTRPGAKEVSEQEEWDRLLPILDLLKNQDSLLQKISIDTKKEEIMIKAASYGVKYINHVCTKPLSPQTVEVLKNHKVSYIAMHIINQPENMQVKPFSVEKSLKSLFGFFSNYKKYLLELGFAEQCLFFDPGIGFGKTDRANWFVLNYLEHFKEDYSLVVGVSRKSFLGRFLGIKNPRERDDPSKVMEILLSFTGAKIIRTHEVEKLINIRSLFSDSSF